MTAATQIDPVDMALIRLTQAGLPRVAEPYAAVGAELGLAGAEVITRLAALQARGVLRRIGAVPNHYRLGYLANGMTVWDVADSQVLTLGAKIGALPFVSHCYQRPRALPLWPYNLFAMVHAHTREEALQQAEVIAAVLGLACRARDILFSRQILKKTGLRVVD